MKIITKTCLVLLISFSLTDLAYCIPIVNPSFENDGSTFFPYGSNDISGWNDNLTFTSGLLLKLSQVTGVTDGLYDAELYAPTGLTLSGGENVFLSQQVDLTNIDQIIFDGLTMSPGGAWQNFIKVSFLIGGIEMWSSQSNGTYLNQTIDTSFSAGVMSNVANDFYIDNLRYVEKAVDVPEPNTLSLLVVGAISLVVRRRYKAR